MKVVRHRRDDPIGGNLADGVVLCIGNEHTSAAIDRDAAGKVEPCGTAGAIPAARVAGRARERGDDAVAGDFANRVIPGVGDENGAVAVHRYALGSRESRVVARTVVAAMFSTRELIRGPLVINNDVAARQLGGNAIRADLYYHTRVSVRDEHVAGPVNRHATGFEEPKRQGRYDPGRGNLSHAPVPAVCDKYVAISVDRDARGSN